jgi:hypothetical protein
LLDGAHRAAVARIGQALQRDAVQIRMAFLAQRHRQLAADNLQTRLQIRRQCGHGPRARLAVVDELTSAVLCAVQPRCGGRLLPAVTVAHGRQPGCHGASAQHRRQVHLAKEAGVTAVAGVGEVGIHQQQARTLHPQTAARRRMNPERHLIDIGLVADRGMAHLEQAQAAVATGQAGPQNRPAFGHYAV